MTVVLSHQRSICPIFSIISLSMGCPLPLSFLTTTQLCSRLGLIIAAQPVIYQSISSYDFYEVKNIERFKNNAQKKLENFAVCDGSIDSKTWTWGQPFQTPNEWVAKSFFSLYHHLTPAYFSTPAFGISNIGTSIRRHIRCRFSIGQLALCRRAAEPSLFPISTPDLNLSSFSVVPAADHDQLLAAEASTAINDILSSYGELPTSKDQLPASKTYLLSDSTFDHNCPVTSDVSSPFIKFAITVAKLVHLVCLLIPFGIIVGVWGAMRSVRSVFQHIFSYGSATPVTPVPMSGSRPSMFQKLDEQLVEYIWQYFYWAVTCAGPCYIKFVQWAGTRSDLFPPSACHRFAKFHYHVSPHPYPYTAKILEDSFGGEWNQKVWIDPNPVGSGCIAQVYRGVILDGSTPDPSDKDPPRFREVAMKIVHPGAAKAMKVGELIKNNIDSIFLLPPLQTWTSYSSFPIASTVFLRSSF